MPSKRKSGAGAASASAQRGKAKKPKEAPAEAQEQQLNSEFSERLSDASSNNVVPSNRACAGDRRRRGAGVPVRRGSDHQGGSSPEMAKTVSGFGQGNMEGDESGVYNCRVTPVEQDFDDFHLDILIAWLCIVMLDMSMHTREPIRDNVLSGPEWVREVLYGHPRRVYEAFRMERHVFLNLCDLMKARGWLKDSRYIRVDEQIGIFLSMICHKNSNRDLCERFQRSGQTISKYFTIVLKAVVKPAKEVIVPPSFDVVPKEILMDPNHTRYFKGCIGAIDGTHVPTSVPVSKQIPFTSKKGITTQNVMCVCSFDMTFSFVYAGWEGCANDRRVLSTALETPRLKFPRPPLGVD
ncbi:uncharacterized protein LOC115743413 isoform X2 [Rhodamnia argentea]|uniref:Uncharacterized protein LOC115743413 isoform X2 n=1 Tax=Rhodamnia argentea TaxID=178133 RepID=A0ABM3HWJ2_9MYRT|nr:uncharacterized protein LOC115743413 isoform X2 [Rhodamnia argentea]